MTVTERAMMVAFTRVILLCGQIIFTGSCLANSLKWEFKVFLDGKEIGYHHFIVSMQNDVVRIETVAQFDVELLFVTVYQYRHHNREVWNQNCLAGIDAVTNDNGDNYVVRGNIQGEQFLITDGTTDQTLPACIMSFAYWNPDFLKEKRLLNSQTGKYEKVTVKQLESDFIRYNEKDINADVYEVLSENGPIKLWYSRSEQNWLALESVTQGGRVLRYQPTYVTVLSGPEN